MTVVLDASAVLALLYREPGSEVVGPLLDGALMSAVNWSEVLTKLTQRGIDPRLAEGLLNLGVDLTSFNKGDAIRAAALWPVGRTKGLSLGDRACLALTQAEPGSTAVTADRVWAELDIPDVTVQLIR